MDRQAVQLPDGGRVFLRVEEVEHEDLCDTIELARPRTDETVMNTHPLTHADWERSR